MNDGLPRMWGVWIYGSGWLRGRNRLVFADMRRDMAVNALDLTAERGKVCLVDQSMEDLEERFLESQAKVEEGNRRVREEFEQERREIHESLKHGPSPLPLSRGERERDGRDGEDEGK